jgi:methylglutaconyl-CoA hydratase
MQHETIALAVDARGVATLRLMRPEKRNALSGAMIAELTAAAGALGADPAVRAVVLAGEGGVFCAGADLGWMMAQVEADRATRMAEARGLAEMLHALNTLRKPLVGRIHGDAFGGGVGMMAVCDTVVAAEGARFALTETRLGLIPATIGPYVVARLGEGMARRVFMSGRRFGSAEAERLGLVARVVAEGDLDAAVEAEVAPYLATAPGAVAAAKALVRALGPPIDAAVIDDTIRQLADTWEGAEAREGIAAFLGKRPAPWAGDTKGSGA